MKYNNSHRENTMMDNLSSTKRKYIENWRQNVSVFMENGNICRVTIAELTPEPSGATKWPNSDTTKVMQSEISPRTEMASPTLPAVKFSYSHAQEEHGALSRQHTRSKSDRSRDGAGRSRTTLPPSPNGVVVQNGMDIHQAYKRRTSAMRAIENNMTSNYEHRDALDKDCTRKSSKLAREIYEKYNMKSKTHNALPGRNTVNGFEQYSMPWRNKTFLSLPLRFNGTLQQRNDRLSREKTYYTGFKYDVDDTLDDIDFAQDWKDMHDW